MTNNDSLPRPSARVTAREVAGQFLVIPTARKASETGSIYALSGAAVRIWELLPEVEHLQELVERLHGEYRVDADTLRGDVEQFVADGLAEGILEVAP